MHQRILLITSRDSGIPEIEIKSICEALEYSRMSYQICDLGRDPFPSLENFSSIVLALESTDSLTVLHASSLSSFVSAGGGLLVVRPFWSGHLSDLFGVSNFLGQPFAQRTANDKTFVSFEYDLYPGLKGLEVTLPYHEYNLSFELKDDASITVIARDQQCKPIAWRRKFGEGIVIYWNSTLPTQRIAIGLIVQSIVATHSIAVTQIANAGVVQIDDFPAPFSNEVLEPLASEFNNIGFMEFLLKFWLPDVLALSAEFEIPLTGLIPFSYDCKTTPPFTFNEWEHALESTRKKNHSSLLEAANKLREIGELGFHGFNHQEMTLNFWGSSDNLENSIKAAMKRWKSDQLGPLPKCFVPPMNILDSQTLSTIKKAIPGLETVCSVYVGEFETGAGREFGPEPSCPEVFSLPRMTWGYEMDHEQQFMTIMNLASLGVWTHFFHPDDVIDTPLNYPMRTEHRNDKSRCWKKNSIDLPSICNELRSWFSYVRTNYPWLNFLTTSAASEKIEHHLKTKLRVFTDSDCVTVASSHSASFQLRIAKDIARSVDFPKNCKLLGEQHNADFTIYTIQKEPGDAVIYLPIDYPRRINEASSEPNRPFVERRKIANGKRKPKLCFVVDVENWAFDNIAKNVSRYLKNEFELATVYTTDFEDEVSLLKHLFLGPTDWDIIHFFWHPILSSLYDSKQFFNIANELHDNERRYLINRIANTCKTTAVYDHKYLSNNEHDALQITSLNLSDGYSVASSKLHHLYRSSPNLTDPLAILSDGVDLDKFKPTSRDSFYSKTPITIGWAGNSSWDRNVQDHKGLHSVIKPLIAKMAAEGINIEGNFCDRAVNWRPPELMPSYYNSIDLYICASLNEGTPNPVLESMASGIPILTTDVGIVNEALGPLQKEFIVPDRTSKEFVEKFRKLVSDPTLRKSLAAENLQYVEKCSWEKRSEDWLKFFASALNQKKSAEQTKFQINALYRAFEAGRPVNTSHVAHHPPVTLQPRCSALKFILLKLKSLKSKQITARRLWQDIKGIGRFYLNRASSKETQRKWIEERNLPACFFKYDWWRYLLEHPDLLATRVTSIIEAAWHWQCDGIKEERNLYPISQFKRFSSFTLEKLVAPSANPRPEQTHFFVLSANSARKTRNCECNNWNAVQSEGNYRTFTVDNNNLYENFYDRANRTLEPRILDVFTSASLRKMEREGWLIYFDEGQRFTRVDSLERIKGAIEPGFDLVAWKHGSSAGHRPLEVPPTNARIPITDAKPAGFAIRASKRHLVVMDDFPGGESRMFRRLLQALEVKWIDDVLTQSEYFADFLEDTAKEKSVTESNSIMAFHQTEFKKHCDLVLTLYDEDSDLSCSENKFFQERLYSYLPVVNNSSSEKLLPVLNDLTPKRVLLIRPETHPAPRFYANFASAINAVPELSKAVDFYGENGTNSRPLAMLIDSNVLNDELEKSGSLNFDKLHASLVNQAEPNQTCMQDVFIGSYR